MKNNKSIFSMEKKSHIERFTKYKISIYQMKCFEDKYKSVNFAVTTCELYINILEAILLQIFNKNK